MLFFISTPKDDPDYFQKKWRRPWVTTDLRHQQTELNTAILLRYAKNYFFAFNRICFAISFISTRDFFIFARPYQVV